MTAVASTRLAWGLMAINLGLVAVDLVLRAAFVQARGAPEGMVLLPVVLILATVGGLVSARRPDNPYGWILGTVALLWIVSGLGIDYGALAVARSLPLNDATVTLAFVANALGWGLFVTYGLLLYPTGSLPGRGVWRVIGWAAGLGLVLMTVGLGWTALRLGAPAMVQLLTGELTGIPEEGPAEILNGIGHVLIFASMLAGAVGLFVRLRRADTIERLQLKWFAYAAALVTISILVQFGDFIGPLGPLLELIAFTILPAVIGIAILRWRLFEIDRVISRTLAYGLLTLLLAAIYLGAVTGLTALTAPVTRESPFAVAAATLLAAAAFGPARRRIQGAVDRRFNRARYDSQQLVHGFATRMRDEVDLAQLTTELHAVSSEALHPTASMLWLRPSRGES